VGPLRDFERSRTLTCIPASAVPLAARWQSAFYACGFWRQPPGSRCAMSRPRLVWALLRRRARPRACRNRPAGVYQRRELVLY